jgi:hypothetical protein
MSEASAYLIEEANGSVGNMLLRKFEVKSIEKSMLFKIVIASNK